MDESTFLSAHIIVPVRLHQNGYLRANSQVDQSFSAMVSSQIGERFNLNQARNAHTSIAVRTPQELQKIGAELVLRLIPTWYQSIDCIDGYPRYHIEPVDAHMRYAREIKEGIHLVVIAIWVDCHIDHHHHSSYREPEDSGKVQNFLDNLWSTSQRIYHQFSSGGTT